MPKFAYKNVKNASTSQTAFELNYNYHFCVFYKKDIDPYFTSKSDDELLSKL